MEIVSRLEITRKKEVFAKMKFLIKLTFIYIFSSELSIFTRIKKNIIAKLIFQGNFRYTSCRPIQKSVLKY